jgi:MFS family permease
MNRQSTSTTVALLGAAQTVAWASSYYLPAMLAAPMAHDLGVAPATVFAAFSVALMVSAPLGPISGRLIDRFGGGPVLMAANLLFATGIAALSIVHGVWGLFLAWAVIGVAMGCGLYDAAFATLARLYGKDSRNAIAGVTLIGGFASTLSWPLSAWMEARWGWRNACLGWASLHLLVGLPLNAALPKRPAVPTPTNDNATADGSPAVTEPAMDPAQQMRTSIVLAFVFAASWFTSVAMAAHLPRLLQAAGVTVVVAVAVGSLIGPAQVAGRVLEIMGLGRVHPLWSARLAAMGHPLGVIALLMLGPAFAPLFALLHGIGNGIMTIARGTLPLALFGAQGYGARQGWLVLPSRVLSALAPYVVGLILDAWGAKTLWLTCGLVVCALLALFSIPRTPLANPGR